MFNYQLPYSSMWKICSEVWGRLFKTVLLCNLELFLLEAIRDLTWVLTHALGIPEAYLLDLILSKGCVKSTCSICLQVMELSGSVISHLLDFEVRAFNKCYLLIWLKNTCRHWLNHFFSSRMLTGSLIYF